MEKNLIDLAKSYLTPELIQRAGALVGEGTAGTHRAMETAIPAVTAGVINDASSVSGAERLLRYLDEAGLRGPMSSIADRLGAGSGEELIRMGKEMLGRIFGGRVGSIVDASASATGVKRSVMDSLLGLAAPLVMGLIGNLVHTRRFDAAGLAGFLGEQKSSVLNALPPEVMNAFGFTPPTRTTTVRTTTPRAEPVRETQRASSRLWPLLLIIPAALLAFLALRRPREPVPAERAREGFGVGVPQEAPPAAPPRVEAPQPAAPSEIELTLPDGRVQRFAEGTLVYDLSQTITAPGNDTGQRFVLDGVTFDTASANLSQGALADIDGIAAVLREHPSVQILLEGHTDSTGTTAAAQKLAVDRANAVKNALVSRGVAADRIATAGHGAERPLGSNDTPDGRAKNRRTELVITHR
ncbi:Putative outer membrane lipoprotein [Minicystis rosea]|nr:Putative outer membrane lipoprotein [Minicystis rosea]